MKRIFLLCLAALIALTTWAGMNDKYDFCVDGIYYYKLSDGSVAVIDSAYQKVTSTYTGDLVIPASVEYDGTPYTVSSIFEYAFYRCYDLTSITLPETVTSIGGQAFGYCTGLMDISFIDGFTEISPGLFMGCTGLEKITVPEAIETIGAEAFESCSNLKEVTIGSSVILIEYMAFSSCTSLEKLYSLNPEPPACGDFMDMGIMGAFFGVPTSTCTLYVPQGCVEDYSSAEQWKDFTNIVEINETITPPTVETLSVTDITNSTATLYGTISAGSEEILEKGFQYWADANAPQTIVATSISDDEISSTIQRLSSATEYTFRAYATTATETYYGDRITFTTTNYDFAEENSEGQTIYYKILSSSGTNRTCEVQYLYYMSTDNIVAYEGELTIPETVTHEGTTYNVIQINEYAFYECRNLTKVIIPESVTAIGPHSFQNCTSLEEATYPNTISTIWEYSFDGCSSLKEAIISNSVTSVRSYVFRGCTSLEEVTFPGSVKNIDIYRGMFADCTGLKKVTLEDGLTNTAPYMFQNCTSLEDVSLPNTMTKFGSYTFTSCTSLKSFVYPNSMTDTGTCVFYGCTNLENITFSKNITEISDGSFAYCTGLEEITIPEGVTTMGWQVFLRCTNIETIKLPKTLESLAMETFKGCSNLASLYSLSLTPPECISFGGVGSWFEDVNENCILYVPTSSKEEYSSATGWKDFSNIVEIDVLLAETAEATYITDTSATLNGSVTKGSFDVTSQGFEYWTDPLVSSFIAVDKDDLSLTLSDLEPNTTYYYRAYATDITGTTYGETLSFTTEDYIPDGIDNVGMSSTDSENIEGIYSTSGQKLNTTQKGVNIIRYTDGTTKKVIMK